jgi:hypothetical protein
MNMPTDLRARCANLLVQAGIATTIEDLIACNAGGNNRTYRLTTPAGTFAVKQYFRHENDTRDRLAAEFGFLEYAAMAAPGIAPSPLSMNAADGLALYEFVQGRAYRTGEVTRTHVEHAARFFVALNSPAARINAGTLPTASEACFSISDHLAVISSRLERLRHAETASDLDLVARNLTELIHGHWLRLADEVVSASRKAGLDPDQPLDATRRCVSPSDFGFHNALAQDDGSPRFLDFEYAGWDDPAKMTGDFFAQLAVPVPPDLFDGFVRQVATVNSRPEEFIVSASLLRPVYQVKWCCIALNVFLPVNLARRRFANPALDEVALKEAQLAKATTLFQSIHPISHGLH